MGNLHHHHHHENKKKKKKAVYATQSKILLLHQQLQRRNNYKEPHNIKLSLKDGEIYSKSIWLQRNPKPTKETPLYRL